VRTLNGNDRYALTLLVAFLIVFAVLAYAPWFRSDWLLENVIVFVGIPVLLLMHPRLPLSKISYTCLFLFLCLHEVGAHYTYAEVPYDQWFEAVFGKGLNEMLGLDRNHFDRSVHFLWGVLLTYPIREVVIRVSDTKGFWAYLLPFLVVISTSTIFELFEWMAAVVFGGELGVAYLGTQGDEWDAQKDMTLALSGSLLASFVIAAVVATINRDFAREWSDSLTVKHPEPLGEVEIARLLEERDNSTE
jgi:putative membrane protein